ncbi:MULTISPECIES: hypothetical protein [unclassified Pseudomonas]|uniref:hypothetical protein n=1 Tax=unclassified Pseudomonas TaxID=196821 RepID=UPI00244A8B6E|nr:MULTISPECIES: hypothetical protein [unclassified Pseudomonas]MDG9929530.1 hypothetical protein [Pseudomonas sp. GD04042]MDH0483592.1 hypothetical protein [Pseudomonas sp. GD04015]MDH0606546.1 hypothetical protein [Pseudomonas sp. GD03869]MDH0893902.1 hypothetical protein [Pseudomonas sp. GD03875]MDH1064421.1 hypothetical protein [Pseudomonas sp. GD03985]
MIRRMLFCLVLGFAASGCVAYGGGYAPGHEVYYQEVRPLPRGYDDRDYRWHRDRYQERRHSHYAPGRDGHYRWHGEYRRHDNHRPRADWRPRYDDRRGWQRHDGWRQPHHRPHHEIRGRAMRR